MEKKNFYYLLIIFYNTNSDTGNKLIFDDQTSISYA